MSTEPEYLDLSDCLDELAEAVAEMGGYWSARLETGHDCAWSAEVRVTRFPNVKDEPDRSVVFFSAGGAEGTDALAEAARAALDEVLTWVPDAGPPRWSDRY